MASVVFYKIAISLFVLIFLYFVFGKDYLDSKVARAESIYYKPHPENNEPGNPYTRLLLLTTIINVVGSVAILYIVVCVTVAPWVFM